MRSSARSTAALHAAAPTTPGSGHHFVNVVIGAEWEVRYAPTTSSAGWG